MLTIRRGHCLSCKPRCLVNKLFDTFAITACSMTTRENRSLENQRNRAQQTDSAHGRENCSVTLEGDIRVLIRGYTSGDGEAPSGKASNRSTSDLQKFF